MLFLLEAHFKILRLPLCLWCQNKSVHDLDFWFRVPIGPARKMIQLKTSIFTILLEKCNFEQTTPNIDILYIVGNHFSPWLIIWDSYLKIRSHLDRLHYQSFDNLSRKVCFEIRPLLSQTEGTVMTMGSSGTCSSQELSSIMARGGGKSRLGHVPSPWPTTTFHGEWGWPSLFWLLLVHLHWRL